MTALAATRARRWTLVWAGALTAAAGWLPLSAAAGLAALAAAAMLVWRFRDRVLGAAIGATVGVAALSLARPTATGATAAVVAVALGPVWWTGYRGSSRHIRRKVRLTSGVLAGVALLGLVGLAAFAVKERSAVAAAVDETRAAVELAGDDPPAAALRFEEAAERFGAIERGLGSPLLLPARLLPVAGVNLDAIRTSASAGVDLNLAASELTSAVDDDALRSADGGVDLATLEDLQPTVATATNRVGRAAVDLELARSPWLLRPLAEGLDELLAELDDASGTARTAELAIEQVPRLLGADGPQRYVMLLGNPAETRDLGGHIGNWAELTAQDGRIDLDLVGQPYELSSPSTSPPLELTPGAYPQSLLDLRPQYFPQNYGGTADFPTVARLTAELFPQARPGAPIDGVIYADPDAFAALLNFTGPERVPGTDITLTPDNAAEFLITGQFEVFDTELEGNEVVNDLIDSVVSRFGTSQLPRPTELAEVLGPLVDSGHLQFFSFDEAAQPLLERLGLTGEVRRPGSGDLLGVMTRNTNPSKIDAYLHRDVEYVADWDPGTGDVDALLRVTLRNEVPEGELPDVVSNRPPGLDAGTNRTTISVLSPWRVDEATMDGEALEIGTQQELRGVRRHSALVDLPPGSTRILELTLSGSVGANLPYVLQWIGQPTVLEGTADVSIRTAGDGDATTTVELDPEVDELIRIVEPSA